MWGQHTLVRRRHSNKVRGQPWQRPTWQPMEPWRTDERHEAGWAALSHGTFTKTTACQGPESPDTSKLWTQSCSVSREEWRNILIEKKKKSVGDLRVEEAKQQYLAPRSKINKSMENSEVISLTVISCGTREQVRYSTEIQSGLQVHKRHETEIQVPFSISNK